MRSRVILGIFLIFIFLSPAYSADDRYARVRLVEGEVQLNSADNSRGDVSVNSPIMDQDEIQTGDGRAEISFRNGILVRIGDYSAVRFDSTYEPMAIQLLQGTLFVDSRIVRSFGEELEVRVAETTVFLIDEGNLRVDLGNEGSVRVTTIEGKAEVSANGRRVLLDPGERSYVDPGNAPESPQAYNSERDELDDWNDSRMAMYDRPRDPNYDREYYDENIYYDAYDLSDHGDWRDYGMYGNVWIPHVYDGWRPYYDGRWSYLNSSWFWISYEPWGWAPYHYGRWGWGIDIGWYWIPGYTFGPSWVSWYDYGNYIGWCPLGYYNRPIYYGHGYGYGGYGGGHHYRPVQKQKTLDVSNTWTFVKKEDLGAAVKKVSLKGDQLKAAKIDRIETNKITSMPHKQLTTYVLPTTVKRPSYVNDKTIVRQPGDIKSPVGIKHDDTAKLDSIKKSSDGKSGANSKPGKPIEKRDWENERKASPQPKSIDRSIKNSPSPQPKNYPSPQAKPRNDSSSSKSGRENSATSKFSREEQFKRSPSSDYKRQYNSYVSPYYRDREREYVRPDDSRYRYEDRYGQPQDVSPRYMEEAKKLFERFDDRNHVTKPDLDYRGRSTQEYKGQSNQPRYEPQPRSQPKESYRAPEVKRPSGGSSSRSNSSSQRPSSSKSHSKPPKQKH